MEHCIGFIGGGNMGRAIMSCLLKAELYQPHQVMVYDAYTPVMEKLEESLHIKSTMDVTKLVKEAEIIVLAVKPQVLPDVLAELKDKIDKNKLIVVAVRTPYDINVLDVPTYVCAYEATVLSFKALVKYLTGEIEAKGILPVSVK